MSSDLLSGEETCLKLDSKSGSYSFPEYVGCAKFIVEWSSRSKMFCELKLQIFCYDERVCSSIAGEFVADVITA